MRCRWVALLVREGSLALPGVLACTLVLAGAPYAGRPVAEVLGEVGQVSQVSDSAVRFVFNDDILPPALRVLAEPAGTTAEAMAREMLAPHGLGLLAVGDAVYAVVRQAQAPPAVAPAALPEIVVTTSRYIVADIRPQPHTFLTQADVQALPKIADEPLRAIQRLPGAAAAGISAQAHLRGGEFRETLMVVDGMPLDEPFHLKNFLTPVSVLDAGVMDTMDVHLGGFTAEQGGAMSGLIDIDTIEPPEDRYTRLGLSLFHASALSAGRFGADRGQWVASVRRSNLDFISDLADSDVGRPEYFDAFGRLSYDLTDATRLFATVLTTGDDIEGNTSDESERTRADYRNTYLWGGWRQQWTAHLASQLVLGLTDIDNQREGTIEEPGQRLASLDDRRTMRASVARLDFEHSLPALYTRFGVEGREIEARYHYASTLLQFADFPFPGDEAALVERALAPRPDGHQTGAYLTSRARLGARLTAEAGLRWDDQTYDEWHGSGQISPRLNLMYEMSDSTLLRAAWGRYWQAQRINELQVEDGVDTFHRPERVDQLIVGIEQALPADIELRVEAYHKDYDHPRARYENLFDPVRLLPELEPDRVRIEPQRARVRGVELLLSQRTAAPWSWWLGYAWSRATDEIEGRNVPRSWDQRHALTAGLRYATERWEISLANSYHSGWPTTGLRVVDGPQGEEIVTTARNAERYGSYNSLDLRVLRRYTLPASTLEAFFEVTNALIQRNPCCTEYEVSDTGDGFVIEAETDHWPKIIPSFGVVWTF